MTNKLLSWYNSERFTAKIFLASSLAEGSPVSLRKRPSTANQQKGFMQLAEEAKREEQKMVGNVRTIPDIQTLRETLRESLLIFEEALDALPLEDREDAWCAYLNTIRKTTFGFHLALIRRSAKRDYATNPTLEHLATILGRSAGEIQKIGRIYRFL